jgi:hypothetical protein
VREVSPTLARCCIDIVLFSRPNSVSGVLAPIMLLEISWLTSVKLESTPEPSPRVRFDPDSFCCDSGRTVDMHEIRRRNLRLLIEEHANGNLSHFVEVTLGGLASYKGLQHVTGPRALRNLGSALARKIEAQLRLERGWMDHDRSGTIHTAAVPGGRSERLVRLAESIESLPPAMRAHVEQIVNALGERPSRRRRKKKQAAGSHVRR